MAKLRPCYRHGNLIAVQTPLVDKLTQLNIFGPCRQTLCTAMIRLNRKPYLDPPVIAGAA